MDRPATAAITRAADDKTHVNRLRVPQIGIVSLCLGTSSKKSKSHLQPDLEPPEAADTGTDDFHFIPEKEAIELRYEIDDPFGLVEEAKLEVFTRFEDAPIFTLDVKTLGETWWAHGKHVVKWDGRIVKPTAAMAGTVEDETRKHDLTTLAADKTVDATRFPDGWVTLEHTPYKVKLTLAADATLKDKPVSAWTYFQILIKGIVLDLGPEEAVPKIGTDDRLALDKAVRKRVEDDGKLPGDGATRKIYLPSNIFKATSGEMDDNTAYDQYSAMWGTGPNIPIVAKIRLADSNDAEVKLDEADKGAVALGNVRFLWDWEDMPDQVDTHVAQATPKAFIKKSIDFYTDGTDTGRAAKDHTYPKGDNCHKDRGGKRGPDADPVFPAQAGYDPKDTLDAAVFPFKVEITPASEALKKRVWASYSRAWTKGKLKGQTGVVFQPSRMAGDRYKVTVYLAYDKTAKDKWTLDAIDEPLVVADALKKATGMFEVWREVHISRYIRKLGTVTDFVAANMATIQGDYAPACLDMVNKLGTDGKYLLADHRLADGSTPDYSAICEAKLVATGNDLFVHHIATDAAANHAADASMFRIRTYPAFVQALHVILNPSGAGDFAATATGGTTVDQLAGALGAHNTTTWPSVPRLNRLKATNAWLVSNALETEVKYCNWFTLRLPFTEVVGALAMMAGRKNGTTAAARDGVTVIHFDHLNNVVKDCIARGLGVNMLKGAAIDAPDQTRNRVVFFLLVDLVAMFVHEIGHHLCLPHAKYPLASPPGGAQEARHDDDDDKCIMGYEPSRNAFCGLCLLRLRGWSATALDKDDDTNKKP